MIVTYIRGKSIWKISNIDDKLLKSDSIFEKELVTDNSLIHGMAGNGLTLVQIINFMYLLALHVISAIHRWKRNTTLIKDMLQF